MNFLAFLTQFAVVYDSLAKGGAKVEADKLLAELLPILAAVPQSTSK